MLNGIFGMIYFYIFLVLQLLDVLTTKKVIDGGGIELNPIMARFIDKLGLVPGLVYPKIVVSLILFLNISIIPVELWGGLIAFYTVIIINNYWVIVKQNAK